MQQLTKQNSQEFLDQFHCFDDGIIRSIHVVLGPTRLQRSATLICSARDQIAGEWRNVRLEVAGLDEFSLTEGRSSYIVLSQGIQLGWFGDRVYLDLGPYTCEPDCEEDFRRSGMLFVGRELSWGSEPYSEDAHC